MKPTVRKIEGDDDVLIFDDTIENKPYTDESELMCWHYDQTTGKNVKEVNILSALIQSGEVAIPIAFECVKKWLHTVT